MAGIQFRRASKDRLGDFEPVDFFLDGTCHFQTITGQAPGLVSLVGLFDGN